MPYTLVLLVTRKAGLTPTEFKNHWESIHIPLLKAIAGNDFPLSHTRHYTEHKSDTSSWYPPETRKFSGPDNFEFDALAVLTFANKAHWERFLVKSMEADAAKKLKEDKEKFQNVAMVKGLFCGETQSTGRDGSDMGWRFVGSV